VPVNVGLASGARVEVAVATNAVVASFVELSVLTGVGAVGVPVRPGEASGAKLERGVPESWTFWLESYQTT